MFRRAALIAVLLGPATLPLAAQRTFPPMPAADRVRLAEALRLDRTVGDRVWPGWHRVPFAILLITDSVEYLVGHPSPSPDFTLLGTDTLLGSEVLARPRVFPTSLLATAPFVGGISTIAVGRAEATGKSSVEWVLTLMHEHFHQLQYSQPGYYDGVAALHLAHGDSTGMWMLNYPFPYDRPEVAVAINALAASLLPLASGSVAVTDEDRTLPSTLTRYQERRAALRRLISPEDDRYFEFQLWQEGVARYTELAVAREAAGGGLPSVAFRALPDYEDYTRATAGELARLHRELADERPAESKRGIVYSLGAATALLLDRSGVRWRARYFSGPFSLDRYFGPAPEGPGPK